MAYRGCIPNNPHRICVFVGDEGICGRPFVAMSNTQDVCPSHSDARRTQKAKDKYRMMRDKPGMPPDSANALTNKILIELPKSFPDGLIIWRCNVGGAYPVAPIRSVIAMMIGGRWQEALRFLQTTRIVIFGLKGLPDIDGMVTIYGLGIRLGIEVKAGSDKQNQAQFDAERVYAKAGCIYIVARSLEQAIEDLKRQVSLLKQQVEMRKR